MKSDSERELLRALRVIRASRDRGYEDGVRDAIDAVLGEVPSNWCDPLLTGPDKVVSTSAPGEVEDLLRAVTKRIEGLRGMGKLVAVLAARYRAR